MPFGIQLACRVTLCCTEPVFGQGDLSKTTKKNSMIFVMLENAIFGGVGEGCCTTGPSDKWQVTSEMACDFACPLSLGPVV